MTEVETLLGDPSLARSELSWVPETPMENLCSEMMREDLAAAKQKALLREHGFNISSAKEL